MVKQLIYLLFLIFFSNAISLNLNTQTENKTNSNSKFNPSMGCTIRLKKKKTKDRVAALSFIEEIQKSLGKYKHCKILFLISFRQIRKSSKRITLLWYNRNSR